MRYITQFTRGYPPYWNRNSTARDFRIRRTFHGHFRFHLSLSSLFFFLSVLSFFFFISLFYQEIIQNRSEKVFIQRASTQWRLYYALSDPHPPRGLRKRDDPFFSTRSPPPNWDHSWSILMAHFSRLRRSWIASKEMLKDGKIERGWERPETRGTKEGVRYHPRLFLRTGNIPLNAGQGTSLWAPPTKNLETSSGLGEGDRQRVSLSRVCGCYGGIIEGSLIRRFFVFKKKRYVTCVEGL